MTIQTAFDIGSPVIVHLDGFFCPGKVDSFVINQYPGAQHINYRITVIEHVSAQTKSGLKNIKSKRQIILPETTLSEYMERFREFKKKDPEATNTRILWEMNKERS